MNSEAITALQLLLADDGLYKGEIDGRYGNLTDLAVDAFLRKRQAPATTRWPAQASMTAFFGSPGSAACTAGRAKLPFAFPLAWDEHQRITQFSCHEKVAAPLTAIFAEAAAHYGQDRFRALRLDRFGGCYNYRPVRGGTAMSVHAWGAAVDLDPERNQLHWGRDKAAFAGADYEPFWKIVEAHGAVSLGRAKNYDWMHFQFARLA